VSATDHGSATAAPPAGRARAASGLVVLVVLLAYAVVLHHGLGPLPDGPVELYSPREFLLQQSWIEPFEAQPLRVVAVFTLPALVLAAAAAWLSRSAVARWLAVSAVLACALFAFYGLRPPGPTIWSFFGWRGSAVMAGLALAVGATATAPLLAASWLRLPVAARIAVYLPVFFGVVAMLRNVTGTDESLRFAISPWPVVPMFGLEFGSVAILGWIAGMAVAAFAFAAPKGSALRRLGGVLLALALPALWFKLWHHSFPTQGMMAMTVVAVLLVAASLLGAGDGGLARRSRHLALGFALAVVPLATGAQLASWDYSRTREVVARQLIDGLARYYEQHQEYPERLPELVEGGFIAMLPAPSIGFSFLGGQEFQYQGFGTSYNLEFSSPDWVQCAYNPGWSDAEWEDEEAYDDEAASEPAPGYDEEASEATAEEAEAEPAGGGDGADAGAAEETSLGEAWSCPSSPPELW
jgi:hypothetical protein